MADPPGRDRAGTRRASEPIPFYRNVKLLGGIAQIVFLVIAIGAILILVRNVRSGLAVSNLQFTFDFLDDRAGFALGETPIPYNPSSPYLRALFVGIVNTLKVAILGIVLTTILGVIVGVMRLSANWLMRQVATWFVELLRNTPLPVQLIFWYFAIILSIPPRIFNSWQIGDVYVSQVGIAMPWIEATPRVSAWYPGLIVAVVAFVGLYLWRRRALARAERPGNAWLLPLAVGVLVAAIGYLPPLFNASPIEGATAELQVDLGRGTVFIDENDNGTYQPRDERFLENTPLVVTIPAGRLTTTTRNITESRQVKESVFRFEQIRPDEVEDLSVAFADPEAAEGLSIHFERYPSVGRVYRDLNGNGAFDRGETGIGEGSERTSFNGVQLVLDVTGFERQFVSERGGRVFFPPFRTAVQGEAATDGAAGAASGGGGGMGALFGGDQDEAAAIDVNVTFLPVAPLVYTRPSIPRSSYVGGVNLSGAFLALLLGLVIYTAAFIAEIVRGGIQAVPKGQTEAAKALGLSGRQVFSLVVFPQATRIILPPMISQYLNLTKNSSLAILVTYEDFFNVSNVIGNQTGQFIPIYLIILVGYLGISLIFSFILNIVNARLALVER